MNGEKLVKINQLATSTTANEATGIRFFAHVKTGHENFWHFS